MDITTIGGIAFTVVAIVVSVFLDKGNIGSLINLSAMLLVVGGTLGATAVSFGIDELTASIKAFSKALRTSLPDTSEVIDQLVSFAQFARKEGLLALDRQLDSVDDSFLRRGMQQVVDGVDPDLVKELLEVELDYLERRHEVQAQIFETAGGYAPTMGIIGTVMGLVHVLSSLGNAAAIGPAIASAFTATLYGIASANVFWLPISAKLKRRSDQEVQLREIMIEGILAIQSGDNPRLVRSKLVSHLAPSKRAGEENESKAAAD